MRIIYKPKKEERVKIGSGFKCKYTPAKICIVFQDDKQTEVNFIASYFNGCKKKVDAIKNAKDDKARKKAIKEFAERKPLSETLKIMGIRANSFACYLDDAEESYSREVFEGFRAVVDYLIEEENAKAKKKASKKAKPAPVVENEPAAEKPASNIESIIEKAIKEGPSIKEIIKKAELKTAEERDKEMRENDPEYRKMAIVKDIFENAEKRAKATKNEPDENAKDEKGRFINEDKERERVYAKMANMNPFEKLVFVKLYNAGLTA